MNSPAYVASDSELRGRVSADMTLDGVLGGTPAHNPGPTDNLRGIEANTEKSKGDTLPTQHGTPGDHGSMVNCAEHPEGYTYRTWEG